MNTPLKQHKIKKCEKIAKRKMEDKAYEERQLDNHDYDNMLRTIGLHESC